MIMIMTGTELQLIHLTYFHSALPASAMNQECNNAVVCLFGRVYGVWMVLLSFTKQLDFFTDMMIPVPSEA